LLVDTFGASDWAAIADRMPGKNQRQCRERWTNYLAPGLNASTWSPEEDFMLIRKYSEFGPKWVQIAAFFPNRTDSMMKNRFNKLQRREQKRRELFLRGEFTFTLPALQCALAAAAPTQRLVVVVPNPQPRPEPERETKNLGTEPEFESEVWVESFGFEDELFSF
jgi:hypothetical protein